uniref:Uncharacterized protein n=1 Tax=Arundo donax TaxID=35708 RepID=A0A0A9P689_ARUDO
MTKVGQPMFCCRVKQYNSQKLCSRLSRKFNIGYYDIPTCYPLKLILHLSTIFPPQLSTMIFRILDRSNPNSMVSSLEEISLTFYFLKKIRLTTSNGSA